MRSTLYTTGVVVLFIGCAKSNFSATSQKYLPQHQAANLKGLVAEDEKDDWEQQGAGEINFSPERQRDSIRRAFVAASGYRHQFDLFYKDQNGACSKLIKQFGLREGEIRYAFRPCPCLDSATYREVSGSYFVDKNGVYCDLSGILLSGKIKLVAGADPFSFRVLGCHTLAADKEHIYLNGQALPGLTLAGLRVYTERGECYDNDLGNIYLVGPTAVYQENQRLSEAKKLKFKLPTGYKQAYPKL